MKTATKFLKRVFFLTIYLAATAGLSLAFGGVVAAVSEQQTVGMVAGVVMYGVCCLAPLMAE